MVNSPCIECPNRNNKCFNNCNKSNKINITITHLETIGSLIKSTSSLKYKLS